MFTTNNVQRHGLNFPFLLVIVVNKAERFLHKFTLKKDWSIELENFEAQHT